jgi:hypothetical protein
MLIVFDLALCVHFALERKQCCSQPPTIAKKLEIHTIYNIQIPVPDQTLPISTISHILQSWCSIGEVKTNGSRDTMTAVDGSQYPQRLQPVSLRRPRYRQIHLQARKRLAVSRDECCGACLCELQESQSGSLPYPSLWNVLTINPLFGD